jgi:hypothetical protein
MTAVFLFQFFRRRNMKDSNKYDPNELPVSGPFAGLDPAQQPVIVDKHGQKVTGDPSETFDEGWQLAGATETSDYGRLHAMMKSLAALAATHNVVIECGAGNKPTHRIVLGDGHFLVQLEQAVDAAVKHHNDRR